MERPRRDQFETLAAYEEARAAYVEHMLGAGSRIASRLQKVELRLAELEKPTQPVEPPPLSLEEQVRKYAHDLIVEKYSAIDQLNITRAATRLGATTKEHVALDKMDEWIEAVRLHCAMILSDIANSTDDVRKSFDITKGWPKEA